jgi:hypothetical protein
MTKYVTPTRLGSLADQSHPQGIAIRTPGGCWLVVIDWDTTARSRLAVLAWFRVKGIRHGIEFRRVEVRRAQQFLAIL